ncbi:MAG: hypothetical protein ACOC2O_02895 [Bacillota bacterium]
MQENIICFGEVLWDVIDHKEYIGGAPFNVSAHLAQLNLNPFLISRLGDDEWGRKRSHSEL